MAMEELHKFLCISMDGQGINIGMPCHPSRRGIIRTEQWGPQGNPHTWSIFYCTWTVSISVFVGEVFCVLHCLINGDWMQKYTE